MWTSKTTLFFLFFLTTSLTTATSTTACSCDCCVGLAEDSGTMAECGLVQLRSDLGKTVPTSCPLSTATCQVVPADGSSSMTADDDYANFCSRNCAQLSSSSTSTSPRRSRTPTSQCVPLRFADDSRVLHPGNTRQKGKLSLLRSGSELSKGKTDRSSTVRTSRKASDPPLSVVKSQMMQAYRYEGSTNSSWSS